MLGPKGFDINFDYQKVVGKINKEIEEREFILEQRTGEGAVEEKAKEIIKERIARNYQPKSVEERVEAFASLNEELLSEFMIYSDSDAEKSKAQRLAKKGEALEKSADGFDEIKKLHQAFKVMKERLKKIEALKNMKNVKVA